MGPWGSKPATIENYFPPRKRNGRDHFHPMPSTVGVKVRTGWSSCQCRRLPYIPAQNGDERDRFHLTHEQNYFATLEIVKTTATYCLPPDKSTKRLLPSGYDQQKPLPPHDPRKAAYCLPLDGSRKKRVVTNTPTGSEDRNWTKSGGKAS